jgi:hypothetical protein
MVTLTANEREEFAVWWDDDGTEDDPLVIYPTYDEAEGVAELGDAIVIRRVITVETVVDWAPCRKTSPSPPS